MLGISLFLAASTANAQTTLNANPTSNNGGGAGWAIFFDLQATSNDLTVIEITSASSAAANASFNVEVFTRSGTALGGPVGSGAGSDPSGWTSLGVVSATQGPTGLGISLPIDIPDIALTAGQLTGVALQFSGAGPRYANGTNGANYTVYSDAELSLTTGDSRSAPFTPTGSFFSVRELVGSLTYEFSVTPPVVYCTAGTTTNGCTANISASSNPSVSAATSCVITIADVEGQKNGIVFYGQIPNAIPWGGGSTSTLCVKAPTQRMAALTSGGTFNLCDGVLVQNWDTWQAANSTALGNPWVVGEKAYVQGWFRDPPAPKTTSLSDAVELTYLP